jgi:hypothetical protein
MSDATPRPVPLTWARCTSTIGPTCQHVATRTETAS